MIALSEKQEFEKAQELKEKLDSLANYQAKSTVVNPKINDVDVFSIISDINSAYVNFLKIVNGTIIQSHTTEVKKKLEETDEEVLEHVIFELREKFNSKSKF